MAKETKAERAARLDQERTEHEQKMQAAYPLRLMTLLERVTATGGFDIDVMNMMFRITGRDREQTWNLSYDYVDYYDDMEELEYVLQMMEDEEAERQKYYTVCNAALEKLTPEERDAMAKMFGGKA